MPTGPRPPEVLLPEPLRGIDRGSFAEFTVATRMPAIARRVLDENELDAHAEERMHRLIDELPHKAVQKLDDPHAPDAEAWNRHVQAIEGRTWLEASWFFSETYFYRRIVEAVGYFGANGSRGMDPFIYQKRRGLEVSEGQINRACDALEEAIASGWEQAWFRRLLKADLWGNQADLSLWPADDQNHPTHEADTADAHLLIDHAAETTGHLDGAGPGTRVDVLVDNAGFELIGDLVLVDYLLSVERAATAVLHVKLHPTFVSDATDPDVRQTINVLAQSDHAATRSAAARLEEHLRSGRLQLRTHPYWTSPLPGWDMPADVRRDLAESQLVISKGDANYRRLLGDLKWPLDTPFEAIASYFPAPLVVLRTYKSELGCGLTAAQVSHLDAEDPDWRTNGRWGIIQLHR